MRRVAFFPFLSLLLIFLLSSCGGGGGGEESTSTPGAAPIATSVAATSITDNSATLNGTVNPNGLATQAWFEYGTDPGLQTPSSSPKQDAGNGSIAQPVSTNLGVLAPGTTYHFRVCAENSGGYSEGQIMSLTTASPGSPPAVTTIAATSVGVTSATLNGSVIPNGLATDAWFEWGTDPALAGYSTTGTQAVGSGTTSQPINQALTGLAPGTIYYYRLAASNATGSAIGSIASFTTESLLSFGVVSTTPTDNATDVPLGSIITVTFTRDVDPATLVGAITVSSLIGDLPGVISYNSTTKTATFAPGTPFAPLTVYTVTVETKVKSEDGVRLPAPYIFSFKTCSASLPGAAPTVSTLAATSVGETGATLNGNVNPNGLPTDAWFEWGTSPTLVTFNTSSTQALGAGTNPLSVTATLSGLDSGTAYYYRVAASNATGSAIGSIAGFTTASLPSFAVVSTTPADNATDVPLGSTITVTFNQDVEPASLVGAITVSSLIGDLPGVISYNTTTKTATFTPGTPFAPLTEYTVTVADKVKSVTTVRLSAPYVFAFKTGSAF